MNARAKNTLAHLRQLKLAGVAQRPRKRVPKQRWPRLIEVEYAKALVGKLQAARVGLQQLLAELPQLLQRARASRKDSDETDRLRALLDRAREVMSNALHPSDVQQLARQFAERTQTAQRIALGAQVKAALGADVFAADTRIPAIRDHFINENVSLIKSIPEQTLGEVEGVVNRAFTDATPHEVVARQIEERFGVGESRARLIARDQIGKLYGQTNAYRQQDLGIESFIWRTVGDERVRDEHEALEGQEFRYDDPPDEGLPGEPIQCRCSAEPVFGDLLKEPDDSEEQAPEPVPEPQREPEPRTRFEPERVAEPVRAPGVSQGTQQQLQYARAQRLEEQRLAQERARVEAQHEAAKAAADEAERAVNELVAQQKAEQEQLHTGFRIGVSSEISGATGAQEIVQATAPIAPRNVASPITPAPDIGARIGEQRIIAEPAPVVERKFIPAPTGFTGIEHEGQVYYQHNLSNRAYTPEQLTEKQAGRHVELSGPNEQIPGYQSLEMKGGEIKHRSESSGQVYTRAQVESGEAADLDKWLLEQEQLSNKKPGLLRRIANKLFALNPNPRGAS